MKHSIGFIGGGRITKILLQAFSNKNVKFHSVVVTDPTSEVTAKLKEQFPFYKGRECFGCSITGYCFYFTSSSGDYGHPGTVEK